MVKKKKKKEKVEEEVVPEQLEVVEEEEKEIIEFTDTSYTSASFESIQLDEGGISYTSFDRRSLKSRTRRKRKSARKQSDKDAVSEILEFKWSDDEDFDLAIGTKVGTSLLEPEPEIIVEEEPIVRDTKKGKKKKEVIEIPDFPKPPLWNQMKKKERQEWLETAIADWEREKEEKRQEELATIKKRRKELAEARRELKRHDEAEMLTRSQILNVLYKQFNKFHDFKAKTLAADLEKEEWQRHILCDGTPNPHVITELYQFLERWNNETDGYRPENVERKLKVVLPILDKLNQFIIQKRYSERQTELFIELQAEFRTRLVDIIEMLAYFLLRDIETNLTRLNSTILTYHKEYKSLNLNLWVAIKKFVVKHPPPKSQLSLRQVSSLRANQRSGRSSQFRNLVLQDESPLELEFPGIKVTIQLPLKFGQTGFSVRAAHFDIDLLSEFSRTWNLPALRLDRNLNLLQLNELEHKETYLLKKKYDIIREEFYRDGKRRIKELQQHIKMFPYLRHDDTREEMERLQLAEPPAVRGPGAEDPRIVIVAQYERAFNRYLNGMNIKLRVGEVNLRQYRILNGMLNLDVLQTPPQPKRCPWECYISTVIPPRRLHYVPYHVRYHPPLSPEVDTRTPEQILDDEQRTRMKLDALVHVTVQLPAELMFFEDPLICQWYSAKTMWTHVYINEYQYDRKTKVVQFRTGILWPIAFAASIYCNYPLVDWEVQPQFGGSGVYVTIEGVYIKLSFLLRGARIRLIAVEKYPEHSLEDVVGRAMSYVNLRKMLQSRGLFIFPSPDCFLYAAGSCPKLFPLETHNYQVMALMSRAYGFKMSRWNAKSGYRDIIFQIREMYSPKYVFKWDLLHTTTRFAVYLKHREANMPYNDETEEIELNLDKVEYLQFCPDLFSLVAKTGSMDVKRAIYNMDPKLSESVAEFLDALKLCSF